jgi:MFS family permease
VSQKSEDGNVGPVRIESSGSRAVTDRGEYDAQRAQPVVAYRGLDVPATLAGMLAALGCLILLAGLLGAALGAIGYQVGLKGNQDELSIGALVAGMVVLFLAFLIGGWTAARIARHHGPRHGLVTVLWFVLLAALFAVLGALFGSAYNVFESLDLPQWFSSTTLTVGAIISGIVALVAMLLAGWLGGKVGDREEPDAVIVRKGERVTVRDGGVLQERGTEAR